MIVVYCLSIKVFLNSLLWLSNLHKAQENGISKLLNMLVVIMIVQDGQDVFNTTQLQQQKFKSMKVIWLHLVFTQEQR